MSVGYPPQFVCAQHFDDQYLEQVVANEISDDPDEAELCGYCDSGELGAPIDRVAEIFQDAINRYYLTAADAGVPWDGGWVFATVDTSDVVYELDGVLDWSVQEAIADHLEPEDW